MVRRHHKRLRRCLAISLAVIAMPMARFARIGAEPRSASLEGHWVSSGIDDSISSATIWRDRDDLRAAFSLWCPAGECEWIADALTIAPIGDHTESPIATITRQGLQVTLRLQDRVLRVETVTTLPKGGPPSVRVSTLVRIEDIAPGDAPSRSATQRIATAAFRDALYVSVPVPAVFDDPTNGGCATDRHLTTTAYVTTIGNRSLLYRLYLAPDGRVMEKRRSVVLPPRGVVRVLVLLINHEETVGPSALGGWEEAQRRINRDYEEFAAARKYPAAIVQMRNTNLLVDPADGPAMMYRAPLGSWLESRRINRDDFDVVMSINIDPRRHEGGQSFTDARSIYIGNFLGRTKTLEPKDWQSIARAAYHHEMAHLWGWEHEWSTACTPSANYSRPFLADPALFGWEDVDGDGVPEILDATPYGRPR
jgi:hypothetical protein